MGNPPAAGVLLLAARRRRAGRITLVARLFPSAKGGLVDSVLAGSRSCVRAGFLPFLLVILVGHLLGQTGAPSSDSTVSSAPTSSNVDALRERVRETPQDPAAHYELGSSLANLGRHEEGAKALEEALRLRPKFPEAQYALGLVRFRSKDLDAAIGRLRQASNKSRFSRKPTTLLVWCWAKRPRHRRGDFSLSRGGTAAARFRGSNRNLGLVLGQARKAEESIEALREAVRLKPDWAEAHNSLAVAIVRRNPREAIEHYQRALELNPISQRSFQPFCCLPQHRRCRQRDRESAAVCGPETGCGDCPRERRQGA